MKLLNKLSLKSLKLNKKRTIGTIIGIILSTSLVCATAGMFTSMRQTLIDDAISESGYYHLKASSVQNEDIEKLKLNRDIKEIKTVEKLGFAYLENGKKEYPYIEINSMNTKTFKELSYEIEEGNFPKTNKEIIINKKTATDTGLKVGDKITLDIGERKSEDGWYLNENNPYNGAEYIENPIKHEYTIVGITNRYSSNYTYYGITVDEESQKKDTYITLKNPSEHEETINAIKKNYKQYGYTENNELLRWEVFAFSDSTISMLYMVLGVVIIIIIITSVFCIKNSFAISCAEKMKMYGMLSSIGATKKQIAKSVKFEAIILGIIGIPLGIFFGTLAVYILIKVINIIGGNLLLPNLGGVHFSISWIVIIISIGLSFITIYLSSISSSIRASRITPIENLKNSNEIKIEAKKLTTPKIINKIFKTGGVLAYKNLKRSKKKYRTTVISLTISIIAFISMSSFIHEMFDVANSYYKSYDYNLSISGVNVKESDIEKILSLKNVNNLHVLYESKQSLKIKDLNKVNKNYNIMLDCEEELDDDLKCPGEEYIGLIIHALDNKSWEKYLKKINLTKEEIKNKGILIDDYRTYNNGKEETIKIYEYKKGDTITGTYDEIETSIEIAKITKTRPYGLENYYYNGGILIINKEDFQNINFDVRTITMNAKDAHKTEDEIIIINEDLYISNYQETMESDKAFKLIFSIFMYGFISVITLIGITNIFNTITSNIELRSKEFAVYKSIGMTKKEFNRMMNLETLFYSFKSLIYGIIIGTTLSYIIHYGVGQKMETAFIVPYISIIISIIFVFFIVSIIMRYSIKKVNKKNTIETIRSENI